MRTYLILISILLAAAIAQATDVALNPTNALCFFIVSNERIPDGRFVDTPELPRVGYISNSPSLVIRGLQSVATNTLHTTENYLGKETQKSQPSVLFTMFPADAKRLGQLTRENIARKMVLTLGDRPLIVAMILDPIEAGKIELTCKEGKESERLAAELRRLVQK
jgi:hypothetical protein